MTLRETSNIVALAFALILPLSASKRFAICVVLTLAACAPTASNEAAPEMRAPQVSPADVSHCEAQTKRLLSGWATSNDEILLLQSIYAPKFFAQLNRWRGVEPGTGPWVTEADHVYESNDPAGLQVRSIGPGRASGNRVFVPVTIGYPGQEAREKSWVFELVNGKWMAVDMIDFDGGSLAQDLAAAG